LNRTRQAHVRFRVDGILHDVASEDRAFQAAIISRVKVMAGLNIAEKRLPQDGRIGLKIAGKDVDIRVSTIPTQFGERVVMRVLDQTATVLDFEQLGVTGRTRELVERLILKPNGTALVTGPTGSGKTTTLYSCLLSVRPIRYPNRRGSIEYQLAERMQVNLKSIYSSPQGPRHTSSDPRCSRWEKSEMQKPLTVIRVSTGHLVLSTPIPMTPQARQRGLSIWE
jgi:general secretion pathway protein E